MKNFSEIWLTVPKLYDIIKAKKGDIKMIIYLIFGQCDGFGNDSFLNGIVKTEEEAKNKLLDTFYYNKKIKELPGEEQQAFLNIKELNSTNEVSNINDAGIYKVEI
nr:MAG TPA: hypothetical protein [Caudoviricetes sp.]